MSWRSSTCAIRLFMMLFPNAHQKLDDKARCSHFGTAAFRPEILFRAYSVPAHRLVLSQATVVISYPVGRLPLSRQPFLMLGVIQPHPTREGKANFEQA